MLTAHLIALVLDLETRSDSIGERVALTQDPGDFARLPVDDARQDQV